MNDLHLLITQQLVDPPSRRMSPYPTRSSAARSSFHKSEGRLFSPTSPTRAAGTIAGTSYHHHHHRGSRGGAGGPVGAGGLRSHSPSPPSRYEATVGAKKPSQLD